MPDDQSEEPPSPDLRSMLTLHAQRQRLHSYCAIYSVFPHARGFRCGVALSRVGASARRAAR